jgi:hypothetical protein
MPVIEYKTSNINNSDNIYSNNLYIKNNTILDKKVSAISVISYIGSTTGNINLTIPDNVAPNFIIIIANATLGIRASGTTREQYVYVRRRLKFDNNEKGILRVEVYGFDSQGNQEDIRSLCTVGTNVTLYAGYDYDKTISHIVTLSARESYGEVIADDTQKITIICG